MKAVPHVQTAPTHDAVSIVHGSLLDAAARADVTAVLQALRTGAEVHAEDPSGRTVVGCAIAGQRYEW